MIFVRVNAVRHSRSTVIAEVVVIGILAVATATGEE
jgi:hypothetical protein